MAVDRNGFDFDRAKAKTAQVYDTTIEILELAAAEAHAHRGGDPHRRRADGGGIEESARLRATERDEAPRRPVAWPWNALMIRHVVMFRWTDGTGDDDVAAMETGLRSMPGLIPQIQEYRFGADFAINEANWDFVVVADFASTNDYVALHRDDAHHQALIKRDLAPHTRNGRPSSTNSTDPRSESRGGEGGGRRGPGHRQEGGGDDAEGASGRRRGPKCSASPARRRPATDAVGPGPTGRPGGWRLAPGEPILLSSSTPSCSRSKAALLRGPGHGKTTIRKSDSSRSSRSSYPNRSCSLEPMAVPPNHASSTPSPASRSATSWPSTPSPPRGPSGGRERSGSGTRSRRSVSRSPPSSGRSAGLCSIAQADRSRCASHRSASSC